LSTEDEDATGAISGVYVGGSVSNLRKKER
jgi:hypothetical protein